MSEKSSLLFLCQRIPYPPDKGEKIRAWRILDHLSRRFSVYLGCFVDDERDWAHTDIVAGRCAGTHFARLDPRRARLRCLGGLVSGKALSLPYFYDRTLAAWTEAVLQTHRPDAVFVYSSAMAQYVLNAPERPGRFVMDFVDVDSDKWGQYAASCSFPMSWIYRRESERLLAFDRAVAAAASASVFVAEPEAALFRRLAPEAAEKTVAIANGIDADYFSPDRDYPQIFTPSDGPVMVFTGTMDYWPNVDAAIWFADEILPLIRQHHPTACFYVVGANPSPEVMALKERDGVVVTGRVEDVRPYIAHADVAVAPVRIARGIQNKVLEAMAMARPVVTTPRALEGIDAAAGREVLLGSDEESFAAAILSVLNGSAPSSLGASARAMVLRAHDWEALLAAFDPLLGIGEGAGASADIAHDQGAEKIGQAHG